MGCLEFWVVNSFLAGLAFFILFLVVDTQYPLYPYGVAGSKDSPDNSKSATACIVAAAVLIRENMIVLCVDWVRIAIVAKEQRIKNREVQRVPCLEKRESYELAKSSRPLD